MSNDSRLEAVRSMLLTAPPGQFDSLVQEFMTIFAAGGEKLEDFWVEEVRSEYHSARDADASDVPQKANELYEGMKAYQEEFYSSKGVFSALSVGEEGDTLVVRTYAERIDDANCQAGSWTAQWSAMPSGEVKGIATVRAHCKEEGSVHLHSIREFGPTHAGNVVKQIREWEQNVVDSIADTHDNMGENLRSLRRIMPVTRTKMDWNVLSHRMVKLLGDSKR